MLYMSSSRKGVVTYGSVFRPVEIYKDWDVPTQVLPSGASCSPGDGHWHRTSPFSTSQPYWQLAMPQVRASDGHKGNTTHIIGREKVGGGVVCNAHTVTLFPSHIHAHTLSLSSGQCVRARLLPDISLVDPEVQTTEQHTLPLLDCCAVQSLCAHTLAHASLTHFTTPKES